MSGTAPGQVEFIDIPPQQMRTNDDFEYGFGEWCRVDRTQPAVPGFMFVWAYGNHYPFALSTEVTLRVKRIVDG